MQTNFNDLKSKGIVYILLFSLLTMSACNQSKTIEMYVSIEGNDNAIGSLSEPFATIPQAIEAIRELRQNGFDNPATIYLREGRHQLNETLVLGIEDGLSSAYKQASTEEPGAGQLADAQLTFTAYPGENPLVSSGTELNGWKLLESASSDLPTVAVGKVWVADMPDGLDKFYTLYDNEGRLNRARAKGFVPTKAGDKKTVHFPEGSMKNWDNLDDVELNIRPGRAWMINMLPLESVDEEKSIAKTKVSATYGIAPLAGWVHTKDGFSAWIENTLDALDEPGEWVINSKTRKIYLWPANPAADGSPRGILAPSTTELIRVEGDINYEGATDKPVIGIAFSGITFTQADRRAWIDDEDQLGWGMQHDWDMFDRPTAALRFRGAEQCQVINCKFVQSGGSGVRFDLHAQRNKVENCEFAHLGEAGILLSGYGPGTKDVNHHNEIVNNHIHHFSEITWHSPGIWAWQSGYNHIAHNYIHHSGYCGVLITCRINPTRSRPDGEGGRTVRHKEISEEVKNNRKRGYVNWQMREKYYHSRHNLLEYNEITHAVQLLSDGNCIYVSGCGTGNIVRYNYLHDNLEHSMPAPFRCDDDQHETLIYGNVLYNNFGFSARIASKGVNDIINNFIVAPRNVPSSGYISYEWVPVPGAKVYKNIIISHPDGGNAHNERPRRDQTSNLPNIEKTEMDSNLYYHATNPNWMDAHLQRMQAIGKEKVSIFADPMFVDPAGGDFSFKEGSPAIKLGIEPLDVSKMGLIK